MQSPYIALYRKYRPETFSDVVGQENAVTLLTQAIKQKKVAHAYLFSGGRGTGKTTVARIVARELGCNDEDIIEIDAASNRGIDEIRELREAVRTAPFSSPYKVYIVDEVHMLTKEAANALLKTLEEPPSHVIFILATTDPHKLPATIVSRCQKVEFKNPDIETLSSRLVYVANEEGFDIDDETAGLIALHGKGSYRDALGVLEQVFAVSKKNVEYKKVAAFLGTTDARKLTTLIEFLCKKDVKGMTETLALLREGNALRAYDDMLELVRKGLLVRVGESTENKDMEQLAKAYPLAISSKTILYLLEKRYLLEIAESHAWTAYEAILLSLTEA